MLRVVDEVYKYSDSSNFNSFGGVSRPYKERIYMDFCICGKDYTTSEGLFYHKRKVHNCTNVRSSRYEYEIKNAAKLTNKKHVNVCFVLNAFVKKQWNIITGKSIKRISRGLSVNLAVVNVEKRCLKIILSGIIYILKMNTT